MNLRDFDIDELKSFFAGIGEKPFRAKQLFAWLCKGISSFDEVSDFSKVLRARLSDMVANGEISLGNLEILQKQQSKTDGTVKYLFGLADGNAVESVFMKYKYGNSICVSSQAGCRMGCAFCASTIGGLKRDLTPGEILMQLITAEKDTGEKIDHIVVMGTGEPFDNFDNVVKFINLAHCQDGLNLSLRNITVSTCGLVPKIYDFGRVLPQVNLAVSLHAHCDRLRDKIMPVNSAYPIAELMEACRSHVRATGRRITFEYALIDGFNADAADAAQLAGLLRGLLCHVNLIPLNRVSESGFSGVAKGQAAAFADALTARGIPATVRRELGSDIDAACGQLRLQTVRSPKAPHN